MPSRFTIPGECVYCETLRSETYQEGDCEHAPICWKCAIGAVTDGTATPDVREALMDHLDQMGEAGILWRMIPVLRRYV